MDETWALMPGLIFTVRCTVTLLLNGTDRPDHVTTPALFTPPASAETKLVSAGIGSGVLNPAGGPVPQVRQGSGEAMLRLPRTTRAEPTMGGADGRGAHGQ